MLGALQGLKVRALSPSLTLHPPTPSEDKEYRAIKRNLKGKARKSRFEDFNANALVLDIDGNGWSDRSGPTRRGGGRTTQAVSRGLV